MTAKDSSYGATVRPAPTNVQVIAPTTLEAGYTFDAMYEGVTFSVIVPPGGVSKGQRFIVPFTPPTTNAIAVAVPASSDAGSGSDDHKQQQFHTGGGAHHGIPTGIWRDGLCDCCTFGPCHPHFICTLLFRPWLIGQILTRMKMTWLGARTRSNVDDSNYLNGSRIQAPGEPWKDTFRKLAIATVVFYGIILFTADPAQNTLDQEVIYNQMSDTAKAKHILNAWSASLFGFYIFYILIQLRATLRHVYSIPEESCLCWYNVFRVCGSNSRDGVCGSSGGSSSNKLCTANVPVGWEDICCAMWCQLCIVGQMARHTVDYREKDAVYCNNVGVGDWNEDEAYDGVEQASVSEGSVLVV